MSQLIQMDLWLLRAGILGGFLMLLLLDRMLLSRSAGRGRLIRGALAAWAAVNLLFLAFLWVTHARFPLHLDLMEGTILQHVRRAAAGLVLYPEPAPEFVPFAYNALFYCLAVPFTWLLGVSLPVLRLVAILGSLGIGAVLFAAVRGRTRSAWWGLIAVGIYAAAYRIMDAYLDTAHGDSWMAFMALLGTLVLDRAKTRAGRSAGLLLLVASFWFKQHGAFFAAGGVLYLTAREGPRRSLPYWLIAALLGPIAYLAAGPALFGPQFHYFTYSVPSRWTEATAKLVPRYLAFILLFYGALVLFAFWNLARERLAKRAAWMETLDPWRVQLLAAFGTAFLGCLDPWSSNNNFIPVGLFLIVEGVRGIHALLSGSASIRVGSLAAAALALVFAQLGYDPRTVLVSTRAEAAYEELIGRLERLDGPVYAPWQGQLDERFAFHPAVHWAALEDMVRGPRKNPEEAALLARLLAPCLEPAGPAYLLANERLEGFPFLAFLLERYALAEDFGDRFEPLRVLPKRFDHHWPRYLYKAKTGR